MNKIKVLEIIGDATLAGAPRHLLSILENCDHRQFGFGVICPPGPLAGEIKALKKPIDLEIIPMRSRLDRRAIKEVRALIKTIKPDIIHIHGTRAGVIGRLAAISLDIPVIYTEHLWTKDYKLSNQITQGIQLFGLWFLDMFTDLNIAVSHSVKDFLVSSQISRPGKIKVVYNAIDDPRQKAKIFKGKTRMLGTVGSLNYQKGIQFLINALPEIIKEFPETKLTIIGEGIYEKHLRALVKKLKVQDNVIFAGFVKNIPDEMVNFDVYVQPSMSESFGLAMVQAMSLGIPVVASRVGGIPEVVSDGHSGILVKSGKPKELAEAIIEILRDPEKAKRMGDKGVDEVRTKFDLKEMIKETEKIYEQMAQQRS